MSVIQAYHVGAPRHPRTHHCVPDVVCADGFSMSVQASAFHYCAPKEDRDDGRYRCWEIAYPSVRERLLLKKYAVGARRQWDPLGSIYSHVPTAVVDAIIAKHGGLKT